MGLAPSLINSGSNPGQAYELDLSYDAGAQVGARQTLINNTFAYDPSTKGAITQLGYSIDRYADFGQLDSQVSLFPGSMMLSQGGNYYRFFTGGSYTPPATSREA